MKPPWSFFYGIQENTLMKCSLVKIICLALSMLLMVTIGVIDRLQKFEEPSENTPSYVYNEYKNENIFGKVTLTPYKAKTPNTQAYSVYPNTLNYDLNSSLLGSNPIISLSERTKKEVHSAGYIGYSTHNQLVKRSQHQDANANPMAWSIRIHKDVLAQNIQPFGHVKDANNLWQPQAAPTGGGGGGGLVSPDDDDDDLGNPLSVPSGLFFLFALGVGYVVVRRV